MGFGCVLSGWRGWCDGVPFTDGLGGVDGGGPQSCGWGCLLESGVCVVFVGVPGCAVVCEVGRQLGWGEDPDVGGGVVDVAGDVHFHHRRLCGWAGRSWAVAVWSMVMVQVPSGSVTVAVSGRPRCAAQVASMWRARSRPVARSGACLVRVMPAMVMVVWPCAVMCALAGGQVCMVSPLWVGSMGNVLWRMHIVSVGGRICERG